ncbi:multidrug effflux MFS transporter [Desulfosarcina ovata]|uniref:Bcr/CflA family drug resistance efflux transporter n=1 Tax=Desulfosarcina ovata subsp. ovata TaxID=2752305 RepID=A0A5K8A8H4_9BACT|nr:multidrug effflux MFS transporter [Desulfosarcina ovata]BBO88837.1 Bcr/CflA family drug resistance efflux transporter [Desulfosarcina ovata subsp. ovata]
MKNRILFLIALLAAFPPLSTDMYLPAIPLLREQWGEPLMVINLTLIGFFVAYCLFLLVYGPISDRYGRRRPLMVGIGIYIMASLACAVSGGIHMMIAARVFQAAGAASASALSLAICKDLFDAESRERIMAHIAVIMALAPMLAPIIGSWVIYWTSWQWVFVAQAVMGAIAFLGVYRMAEPLKTFTTVSPKKVIGVYFRLLANGRYTSLVFSMSLLVFPMFAFIAASSEIYISHFGLSEREFGIVFGANAMASMFGSLVFGRLSLYVRMEKLITLSFAGILLAGVWMLLGPHVSPWSLALPMATMTFFFGLNRPPTNNLILEQVHQDVGAASSLLVFTFMILGASSMGIVSLQWTDKITVLGSMAALSGGLVLLFWLRYKDVFLAALPRRRPG